MKTSAFIKSLMIDYNLFFNKVIDEIKINTNFLTKSATKQHNKNVHLNQIKNMKSLTKLSVWVILGLSISLTSCKKDLPFNGQDPVKKDPASFKEIKTTPTFSWNTHKEINFTFNGVPTIEPTFGTLRVNLTDGRELLKVNQKLSENYNTKLTVPGHLTSLEAGFGSNKTTIQINGNSAVFNYTDLFPSEPENE
ncbi:MAG: hypothetical protein ACK4K9_06605 [Bacteroidia bacterium]